MKETVICLDSIKSKCFMLVVCFALLMGVTSCSNDDFEAGVPDEQKKLSNAELIEMALSRMPNRTRSDAPFPVVMVTTAKTVTIYCEATEDMVIHWGEASTPIPKNTYIQLTHTYSTDEDSYGIFLEGSNEAITKLEIRQNELVFLDITNNTRLEYLNCIRNELLELNLTGCPNLKDLWADYNNLSSIDVTHLPHLRNLGLASNQLTNLDVSKNKILGLLQVGGNQIKDLDLTNNKSLTQLSLRDLPISTINNLPISSTSFAAFPHLNYLYISNTPFTSLDLSNNPLMYGLSISDTPCTSLDLSNNPLLNYLDISGAAITQLDISNFKIQFLLATNSNLTKLIYTSNSLLNATYLRIEDTPFEKIQSNMLSLITKLPNKNSPDNYGFLFTNSSAFVAPLLSLLEAKNWILNPPVNKINQRIDNPAIY